MAEFVLRIGPRSRPITCDPFPACELLSPSLFNFGARVALTWGYVHHGRSTRAGSSILLPRALLPALDHTLPRCVSIKVEFHYHSFQAGVRGTSHLWGVRPSCIRAVSHSRLKRSQSAPCVQNQTGQRETRAPALFRRHNRRHVPSPRGWMWRLIGGELFFFRRFDGRYIFMGRVDAQAGKYLHGLCNPDDGPPHFWHWEGRIWGGTNFAAT